MSVVAVSQVVEQRVELGQPLGARDKADFAAVQRRRARALARSRDKLAATYQNLLCADEHILRDIGMTRMDVLRLREDLFRK